METNFPISTTSSSTHGFEWTVESYPISTARDPFDVEDQYHTISHMLYSYLYENSNVTSQNTPIDVRTL